MSNLNKNIKTKKSNKLNNLIVHTISRTKYTCYFFNTYIIIIFVLFLYVTNHPSTSHLLHKFPYRLISFIA